MNIENLTDEDIYILLQYLENSDKNRPTIEPKLLPSKPIKNEQEKDND